MATALDQPTGGTARRSAGISAVLDVLDALDRHGPVTLAQLSRETGVAKSTLHRVCCTMGERGWIARDLASGNIELGPRVAWLARANPASALTAGFYEVARGIVERHNETTCLTVLDGCESVFVAKHETTHPVRLVTAVGSRLPAFASASGRAMLADLPEAEVTALFKGSELVTPTGRRLRGRVAGAITLCVPSGRMDAARKRKMLPDLIAAARTLAGPWASRSGHRKILVSRLNNLSLSPDTTVAAATAAGRHGPDHEREGAQ
jgi:DNA-binding IclR family transcriptional regulator